MAIDAETKELLKEMQKQNMAAMATLAAEMRKPTEVEQLKLDEDERAKKEMLKERKENAASVKAQMAMVKQIQATCSHQHADGHTHLVHVKDNDRNLLDRAGYLQCQWCNVRIRPDDEHAKQLDPGAVYDTSMFNRLYQTLPNREIFG